MKLDRKSLRKILIQEACGCMGIDSVDYLEDDVMDMPVHHKPSVNMGGIDKESVVNCVVVLAQAVDCPVTREILLSAVHEIA